MSSDRSLAGENPVDVVVTGTSVIASPGAAPDELWSGLANGVPEVERLASQSLNFPFSRAYAPPDYSVEDFVPKKSDRRSMGESMLLAAVAAGRALEAAGIRDEASLLSETALFVAAKFGERDAELDFELTNRIAMEGKSCTDYREVLIESLSRNLRPGLFLAQLPNLFAGNIALLYQLLGPCMTFVGEHAAGSRAIYEAYSLVRDGQTDRAIAGAAFNAADYQTRFAAAGSGTLSKDLDDRDTRPSAAWSPQSDGVVLGTGAAFVVFESAEAAARRSAPVLARVSSCHFSSAPRRNGAIAERLTAALNSWSSASERGLSAIVGHGAGFSATDVEEARFLSQLDPSREVLVTSPAPLVGDVVHAAAPLRIGLACEALVRQELFPVPDGCGGDWITRGPARIVRGREPAELQSIAAVTVGHFEGESMTILERP